MVVWELVCLHHGLRTETDDLRGDKDRKNEEDEVD